MTDRDEERRGWREQEPQGGARHLPWAEARAAWAQRDFNLGEAPIDLAKELFAAEQPPCPGCGSAPRSHTWVCVEPDGERTVGWLTICEPCVLQVGWVVDEELTALAFGEG